MKYINAFILVLIVPLFWECKSVPSICEPSGSLETCNLPERKGFVNDYCNFLTDEERNNLEAIVSNYFNKTNTKIIIIIEDSPKAHSLKFHNYACLVPKLGYNLQTFDDVLMVVSKKRKYVDINYGLRSGNHFSADDHRIVQRKNILPLFDQKKYFEGLKRGINYIIEHRK
ncbi:TPM domain-containing protein [Flavobacterium sp. CYK-55]|uniref:TPM domain-containing protein n=1 Tax=Flavobacterium sp. CYK-55 TaxID=2835529 RepID=UPI001BCB2899|nr:TPM domain-containing protein [Flavobacterium sp. CYK-55]MBS7787610.1 TPM domain-containing protein [Flavobacterium sp. CYK-55]